MPIGQYTSQVIPTMLETVRPKLSQFLVMKQSNLMNLFNKAAEKHNVSAWTDAGANGQAGGAVLAWRVPVLLWVGGDYQAVSLDGGSLGTGSMMGTGFMAFGTFENSLGFNIPMRAQMATKDQKQAVTNVLQKTMGWAIGEMALYNEIGFFQDSTGILAQANGTGSPTSGGAGTPTTYNLETSQFSYIRLRGKNALVDVYSTAGVLVCTNARITSINFAANTVTITSGSAYSAGPVNTDQLAFPNMGLGAGTGAYNVVAGSWRNGLYTFSSTNSSASVGGLSPANAYEIVTPQVNAAGGFYTPSLLYSGKTQLVQRRDDEAYSSAIGICHMAQRTSWYLQGLTISNWFRGASDKMIDLAPKGTDYGDTFMAGDVKHYVSRYAGKSRVDWAVPQNYGWVQLQEIDFAQTPEGQRMFIGRGSDGNPQAGFQTYLLNTKQLYCVDPGCGVIFYGLSIPAGQ